MRINPEGRQLSLKLEKSDEWMNWINKIPFINFPKEWNIQIIPPFSGAIIRFRVNKKIEDKDNYVSVYLDCYNRLACYGEPYWEIYPYEGDVFRCGMNDIDALLKAIEISLNNDGE